MHYVGKGSGRGGYYDDFTTDSNSFNPVGGKGQGKGGRGGGFPSSAPLPPSTASPAPPLPPTPRPVSGSATAAEYHGGYVASYGPAPGFSTAQWGTGPGVHAGGQGFAAHGMTEVPIYPQDSQQIFQHQAGAHRSAMPPEYSNVYPPQAYQQEVAQHRQGGVPPHMVPQGAYGYTMANAGANPYQPGMQPALIPMGGAPLPPMPHPSHGGCYDGRIYDGAPPLPSGAHPNFARGNPPPIPPPQSFHYPKGGGAKGKGGKGAGGKGKGKGKGGGRMSKKAMQMAEVYRCAACRVDCSGEVSFVQHCQGKAHAAKAGFVGFAGLLPNDMNVVPHLSQDAINAAAVSVQMQKKERARQEKEDAKVVRVGISAENEQLLRSALQRSVSEDQLAAAEETAQAATDHLFHTSVSLQRLASGMSEMQLAGGPQLAATGALLEEEGGWWSTESPSAGLPGAAIPGAGLPGGASTMLPDRPSHHHAASYHDLGMSAPLPSAEALLDGRVLAPPLPNAYPVDAPAPRGTSQLRTNVANDANGVPGAAPPPLPRRGSLLSPPTPIPGGGPMMHERQNLPIFSFKQQVLDMIETNQVSVVEGETGCGKTTQVPQYLLETAAEEGRICNIICTQPRRISAMGVAERVAAERGEPLGRTVGYTIRLENCVSAATRLLFCTTGILLRRLEEESALDDVTHVFVDEVHERSMESDFLLMVLRDLLQRRPALRLVLMSATVDARMFNAYFGSAQSVCVPGRIFPVTELYLEDALELTGHRVHTTAEWARSKPGVRKSQAGPRAARYLLWCACWWSDREQAEEVRGINRLFRAPC
ncbi:hypothetical protein CYMTET_21238 [Cymbomonas tetramitiformis]|uniref:Helicase ATP-binding domain-containing protein n=1 Tax=Cymbomonas tetramitiformis TaxID=36881 RepID=A0AAE0L3D7_9CHLO|nr:hypothetical protein CYMTET_21238 [Cymbomonas tetramitiformis]